MDLIVVGVSDIFAGSIFEHSDDVELISFELFIWDGIGYFR